MLPTLVHPKEVQSIAADPPRAVLIRAMGRVVSAGVDVQFFADMDPEDTVDFWRHALEIVERIETLPCPVVFAAHALTLTAAFEISLACDLIVAARSAKFGLVENVVALSPSMGGPARIAEPTTPPSGSYVPLPRRGWRWPIRCCPRWSDRSSAARTTRMRSQVSSRTARGTPRPCMASEGRGHRRGQAAL